MPVGFYVFCAILIVIGISYMKTGSYFGFLKGKKKEDTRQQPAEPARAPSAALDAAEVRSLGEAAAAWCAACIQSSSADHKWLVIEVKRDSMDCRSVTTSHPYNNYPHCTVNFSREIDWDTAASVAQRILGVISARCPQMIGVYGLYLDGHSLILPTNGV